ncbi:GNAT family N-acetyltransferase [Sphingomonas baiyangensis]|uniref:N-acetyltransferase n=1 Tax=Sphingomonas baiyangensis TaxID=2572576 RepID=A0A4V5PUS5_9SPHN|nr:N-acetyltransferase [Sphingomonas baiyangensis]TKD51318.1 N-acetyltransferase [Sphingomonas baiyangensis]
MEIRPAQPDDVPGIDALLRASFPAADEAMLVQRLCIDGDMVLTMVAHDEAESGVVGMAAFSRMDVAVNGRAVAAVALAPVATLPGWRRQGIAEMLIAAGHDMLERAGYVLAFVLGDRGYYRRFGYDADWAKGFDSPYAGEHLMVLPLQSAGMPCGVRGHAAHARAFAALAGAGEGA